MDNKLLYDLIVIANELENKEMYVEAGQVDNLIKKAQNVIALPSLILNMVKAMNKQKAVMKYTIQDIQQMTDGDELIQIKQNIKKFFQNMAKMLVAVLQFCDIPIPPFVSSIVANQITNANVREFCLLINNLPSLITKSKAFKMASYVMAPLKFLREMKEIGDRYIAADNRMVALDIEEPEEEQQVAIEESGEEGREEQEEQAKKFTKDNKLPKAASQV